MPKYHGGTQGRVPLLLVLRVRAGDGPPVCTAARLPYGIADCHHCGHDLRGPGSNSTKLPVIMLEYSLQHALPG